jgi:hypothetical protein
MPGQGAWGTTASLGGGPFGPGWARRIKTPAIAILRIFQSREVNRQLPLVNASQSLIKQLDRNFLQKILGRALPIYSAFFNRNN